jgi:hypothetical protein
MAEDLNHNQRRCGKFSYQNISARTFNEDIRQLAMEPIRCIETSDTDHETTRRHVPKEGMRQKNRRQNRKHKI